MNLSNKELAQKITDAANIIAGKARRGPGDYMIVSSELAQTMLDVLEEQRHRERMKQRRLKIEKLRSKI